MDMNEVGQAAECGAAGQKRHGQQSAVATGRERAQ